MLNWIKSRIANRWAHWRINRWIGLRRKDVPREIALERSSLTAGEAFAILDGTIGCGLSRVGIAEVRGRTITPTSNFGQIALVLRTLADLSHVLPVEEREKVALLIGQLQVHNWGGVRRGADAALEVLDPADALKAEEEAKRTAARAGGVAALMWGVEKS